MYIYFERRHNSLFCKKGGTDMERAANLDLAFIFVSKSAE
jgi:hypothetical protein